MSKLLRLLILGILLGFYSISVNAANTPISPDSKPEFIPIIKKPCYIGCNYEFQFCYYYNISNMKNAITVTAWKVEKGYVTGRAVADIKAKLLIKLCYQLSLSAAYPVVDDEINLDAEFEFKIKLNDDASGQCVDDRDSSITYSSFELKGNLKADPIPLMQGQLSQDMADIIKDSVSKAVHDSLAEDEGNKRIYCGKDQDDTKENDLGCQCDY